MNKEESELISKTRKEIIDYIENDSEVLIPIERFFNKDGTQITKNQYGKVVIEFLVEELRERFK